MADAPLRGTICHMTSPDRVSTDPLVRAALVALDDCWTTWATLPRDWKPRLAGAITRSVQAVAMSMPTTALAD